MSNKTLIAYYLGRRTDNPKSEFFDWVICLFSKSKYSHVELVTSYNPKTGNGVGWTSSQRDGGVRSSLINFKSGRWELYEVDTYMTDVDVERWFRPHLGQKYDWLGAFATIIPFFRNSNHRWFCSEIVGNCLGIPSSSRLTPKGVFDYLKSKSTKI